MHLCSWKMSGSFQNGNFSSVHQITKHQHPHFQRQHEITTFVTNQNIHYTLHPMAHPGPVYWKADAPKSRNYYNPLPELAAVLLCSPAGLGCCALFREGGRCHRKDACGCRFPRRPSLFLSLLFQGCVR